MQLKTLLNEIEYEGILPLGDATVVIRDSRKMKVGAVFVCSVGANYDSHSFAAQAVEKGAALVVTSYPMGLKNEITVKDTVKTYALLCHNFFGNPAKKLRLAVVTGTNGKTTVTFV